jgi:hypothetical protein
MMPPAFAQGPVRWHQAMLWLLLVFGQLTGLAYAEPLAIGAAGSYALSRAFRFFEDNTVSLVLDQLLKAPVQSRFRPIAEAAASTH